MAMPVTRHWTTDAVRELTQEDRPWPRYELLDGELLVTPAPRGPHQTAAGEVWKLLEDYVWSRRLGATMLSPADLELRTGTIVQPDVFVVPAGIANIDREPEWSDITALSLAVEILSPSSVRNDRVLKRDFYLENNVDEYWVVDVDARVIERWRPRQETPELLRETLEWSPRGDDPLVIDVPALFNRIDEKWQVIQKLRLNFPDARAP
jgi:Uma2 family endonuclease